MLVVAASPRDAGVRVGHSCVAWRRSYLADLKTEPVYVRGVIHPAFAPSPNFALPEPRRTWYRWSFWIAAAYNVLWGTTVILLPAWTLSLVGIETDAVGLLLWQCIGMFVGVFAVGYHALARQPERYAPFLWIALIGKICGPIGFVYGAFYLGVLPRSLGWTILTNDLIWWPIWIPFAVETLRRRR